MNSLFKKIQEILRSLIILRNIKKGKEKKNKHFMFRKYLILKASILRFQASMIRKIKLSHTFVKNILISNILSIRKKFTNPCTNYIILRSLSNNFPHPCNNFHPPFARSLSRNVVFSRILEYNLITLLGRSSFWKEKS